VHAGAARFFKQAAPEEPLDEWAVLEALALLVDRSLVLALTPDDAP